MAKARKFQTGKMEPSEDPQALKFGDILTGPVELDASFDQDAEFPAFSAIKIPMFLNDRMGCCVISARAHQTLRFEFVEQQGVVLSITPAEITREFVAEGGNPNDPRSGLVARDSLTSWRDRGWRAGGQRHKIHHFADLNWNSKKELKTCIFCRLGVGLGMRLPGDYEDLFQSGREWDGSIVGSPQFRHYVAATGYTEDGLTIVTWGERRHITWDFIARNCDEAFGIIDNENQFDDQDVPIDMAVVQAHRDETVA